MTLLSICFKLYMLNVLQYSKIQPLCLLKNQTFPFITPDTTTSTSVTTSNVTTTITSTTTTTTTTSTTTASPATTSNATLTTASTSASTAAPTVTSPAVTTLINTRVSGRSIQKSVSNNGYQYNNPSGANCPNNVEYCLNDGTPPTPNCPCFDLRTSQLSGKSTTARVCVGPERDRGICTTIKNCPLIVEEYYAVLMKRHGISYEEFLTLSKCRETFDLICCPNRSS